jgi:large subunit ribosomal protein L35
MPKMKSRRSISKRFRLTGSGKLMRKQMNRRHILVDKPAKRMRRLGGVVEVNPRDSKRLIDFISK